MKIKIRKGKIITPHGSQLDPMSANVPDPVVLQQVKGGYLIITAWGDEASDENVVNQLFN